MKKLLLICSAVAMMCGDCAWGMGDDLYANPWAGESASKPRRNSGAGENPKNSNMARRNSGIISTAMNLLRRSKSDSQLNNENLRQKNYAGSRVVAAQTEQSWNGQTQANPRQLQENRFIKIGDYTYMQYHYDLSNNSKIGYATPTTVITITKDDLKNWNDISEIRYANDVSYDKLENPKVILYRNKDNSCYIILRTDDGKKYGVFYGLNERNVEIGRQSFAVYEVSEDVGSFTDGVERLIYVDESGLYFVPANENPMEDVIKTYQNEGKFDFEGSVIKVSAIDGTITLDGKPITKENFFDNWVLEEREIEREVSKERGRTVIEQVKETKQVLSTKQPKSEEVIRNFYSHERQNIWSRTAINLFFANKHLIIEKAKSKNGAKELVRDGTFSFILSIYSDMNYLGGQYVDNVNGYTKKVRDAIAGQVSHREGRISFGSSSKSYSISEMVSYNSGLFKDPEFVRSLKPAFKKLEKDYEHNKESEMWLPFEIVRNL